MEFQRWDQSWPECADCKDHILYPAFWERFHQLRVAIELPQWMNLFSLSESHACKITLELIKLEVNFGVWHKTPRWLTKYEMIKFSQLVFLSDMQNIQELRYVSIKNWSTMQMQ